MAIDINSNEFEKEVIKSDIPVLVDFWGPQCAPCLALMPEVENLEETLEGALKLVKIDASQNKRFCLSMKVLGLPTYLFYKNGKEVDRLSGESTQLENIKEKVEQILE